MRRNFVFLLVLVAAVALLPSAIWASTVNTFASWDGSNWQGGFGYSFSSTYGQTFTAPGTSLTDFEFVMKHFQFSGNTQDITFRAYVMAWDPGTREATGAPLYTSANTIVSGTSPAWTYVTFTPAGSVPLTLNNHYVALVSVDGSDIFKSTNGPGEMGYVSDVYSGGSFVYLNDATGNSANWTTGSWSVIGSGDLAFKADFAGGAAPTPEPGSMLLLASGLVGLANTVRRRMKR